MLVQRDEESCYMLDGFVFHVSEEVFLIRGWLPLFKGQRSKKGGSPAQLYELVNQGRLRSEEVMQNP